VADFFAMFQTFFSEQMNIIFYQDLNILVLEVTRPRSKINFVCVPCRFWIMKRKNWFGVSCRTYGGCRELVKIELALKP